VLDYRRLIQVDLPNDRMTVDFEAGAVVFAPGIVVGIEVVEFLHSLKYRAAF
jgi:hypothetical protein